MTIIECVKEHMSGCPLLSEIPPKNRHIDWTEDKPNDYGIFPSGDSETGPAYINGDERRTYTFAFYIRKMTDTDAARLENSGFMERLQEWLDEHPISLPEHHTYVSASAENAMLLELNKAGNKGTYQVQCSIDYIKHFFSGKDE